MRDKTDIWLYIIVGLMCVALLLIIAADATAIYGIVNPSNGYERGYMDGFRDGMLMHDMDYGTIKLERKGGEE